MPGERLLGWPRPLKPDTLNAMLVRYDIRPDRDGWTIYERTTGEPAVVEGFASVALRYADADELVDLLNTLNFLKRPTLH